MDCKVTLQLSRTRTFRLTIDNYEVILRKSCCLFPSHSKNSLSFRVKADTTSFMSMMELMNLGLIGRLTMAPEEMFPTSGLETLQLSGGKQIQVKLALT